MSMYSHYGNQFHGFVSACGYLNTYIYKSGRVFGLKRSFRKLSNCNNARVIWQMEVDSCLEQGLGVMLV